MLRLLPGADSFPLLPDAEVAGSGIMASKIGSRRLTVLREFRPHGLAVEEADGEGAPGAPPPQDYDYFLFDPALAVSPTPDPSDEASSSGADGDHELFIRGNQCVSSPFSLSVALDEASQRK